jgi:hypothetical protein
MGEAKRRRAAQQRGTGPDNDPPILGEIMDSCPFSSLIGRDIPPGSTLDSVGHRIGCTVAVMGGQPEPLNAEMIASAVETLLSGRIVMVLSDRADLADYAKREIVNMAGPTWGAA